MKDYYFNPEIKSLNDLLGKRLANNGGGVLHDLKNLMRPKKIKDGEWVRISVCGELGLSHYNSGIHDIHIRVVGNYENKIISYGVLFHIGNLDDGEWQAWSKYFPTIQEAIDLVEKIAPILDDLVVLPTSDELNEMLKPFGMYGELS